MKLPEYVDRLEKMLDRHDKVCGSKPRCPAGKYYRIILWGDRDLSTCQMCKEFVGLSHKINTLCPCIRTSPKETARQRARKAIARYRARGK